MHKPNPLMLLADKFMAADPSLTREAAILRAGDEVLRFKSGQPLSRAATRARELTLRADKHVAAGKSREDAFVLADKEMPREYVIRRSRD